MSERINGEYIRTLEQAPDHEPQRQYYFIDKCREIILKRKESSSHEMTFYVETFGCQMNERDSEKLRGILEEIGFAKSDDEDADIVLYNTCTVRENANVRVFGRLGSLKTKKKNNPDMIVALCGCMMQDPLVVDELLKKYRFVDLIFGTFNIYKLAELLYKALMSDETVVDIQKSTETIVEQLPVDRTYFFKSGVNIMYGCNNFCSYCIVPYVRGREKSREPEDIISEIRALTNDGVKEVMLLGQNVNSYGKTLDTKTDFASLLHKVAQVDGIERIRFMTSHPKDLSDGLIEAMASEPKICPHLHLPLQSGSSRILKLMNRRYDKERYLELVDKIRKAVPDISLTTDIIVGFPGETEEDFLETMDVVDKVGFDSAFTFIYSKRHGTPAADMPDQIPEDVVKDRFDRLLALVQEKARKSCARFEGQTLPVLVENINTHDPRLVTGRLANNITVHFEGSSRLIGQIADVKLNECKGFYYMGELA